MCHFAEHGVQLALEALSLHTAARVILAALTCYTLNSQIMSTIKFYSFFFRLLTLISIIPLCKKLRAFLTLSNLVFPTQKISLVAVVYLN